jgi:hypothetical protein
MATDRGSLAPNTKTDAEAVPSRTPAPRPGNDGGGAPLKEKKKKKEKTSVKKKRSGPSSDKLTASPDAQRALKVKRPPTKEEIEEAGGKTGWRYARKRPFGYLKYISIKKLWREHLARDLIKCFRRHEDEAIEAYKLGRINGDGRKGTGLPPKKLKKWRRKKHGSQWCSAEEALSLASQRYEKSEETGGLFGAPRIKESAGNMLRGAMNVILEKMLLGINDRCRSNGRRVANASDLTAQVLSVHGLKKGVPLMSDVLNRLASRLPTSDLGSSDRGDGDGGKK